MAMPLNPLPPKQATSGSEIKNEDIVYTEDELESSITLSNDASYFEKAQDFRHVVKTLRIKYLGLKPIPRKDSEGNNTIVYVKDKNKVTGINEEGVEANVRFLETRLGQHSVLTSWNEERMYNVLLFDMKAWLDMTILNFERWDMTNAAAIELCTLINDNLEFAYRRAVDNKERQDMRPFTSEIKKLLGWDDAQKTLDQVKYPTELIDKMRGRQDGNMPPY